MKTGERFRSKNTMFWRADELVKSLLRDERYVRFLRACGQSGLFFDDIDPINDKPLEDVTAGMRGRGYQAIAFRVDKDPRGFFIQRFVARGTGSGPLEATLDAYRQARSAGDPVGEGLEAILTGGEATAVVPEFDVMELIG